MQISGLGIEPSTAITVGSTFFSELFGGDDINYAINFSKEAGLGKQFLQSEANAYHARGTQLLQKYPEAGRIMGVDIAKAEFKAGRPLSDIEILTLLGKTPVTIPAGFPSAFPYPFPSDYQPTAPSPVPWPLIIGGGIAILGIGTALFIGKK